MTSEILKQHCISLVKLLSLYNTQKINKKHLQVTHQFCQSLLTSAKTHPDMVFAQPQLYKSQLPYTVNLALNTCINVCLIGIRNKVDESVCLQIMNASLSLIACNQASINDYQLPENTKSIKLFKDNSLLETQLDTHNQHIWHSAYLTYKALNERKVACLNQLNKLQRLVYLGYKLAILCTPNKHSKAVKFAHAFKQLCLTSPPSWYETLEPLLQYPSLVPPGTIIKHVDNSMLIIVSINEQGLVVKPMKRPTQNRSIEGEDEDINVGLIPLTQVSQFYLPQSINKMSQFNYWWNEDNESYLTTNPAAKRVLAFEQKLAFQSPPPSLLVIQDQLTNINTDISVITKAIEKEPAYVQQLKQSATIGNRQKQPVETIQHGLAMLGYERTSCLLLEHSLLSRLNQEYFPLQKQFIVFSSIYSTIAAEIANTNKSMTYEIVSSTAYFVLSRLFSLPQLRTKMNWEVDNKRHFEVSNLIKVNGNNTLKSGAIILAQAWQQPANILQALKSYDALDTLHNSNKKHQLSYILGLSLIIAKQVYFQTPTSCPDTLRYKNNALDTLHLSDTQITEITEQALSKTMIYSTLN
ncbi:hypothetical protein [Paraglaciecola sp.]|uniref:hypothetical protein n=1 Tax=Paraglaciecola sp. TaxID=1920173 RepID=UPI003EF17EAC